MTANAREQRFVLCIKNDGYAASLDVKKIYPRLPDPSGDAHGLVRVVDESGEDYLYPADYFIPIDVPDAATKLFSNVT